MVAGPEGRPGPAGHGVRGRLGRPITASTRVPAGQPALEMAGDGAGGRRPSWRTAAGPAGHPRNLRRGSNYHDGQGAAEPRREAARGGAGLGVGHG